MKKILIVLFALLLMLTAGCGSGDDGDGDANKSTGSVTIGDYELPVYPNATVVSETGMSASYNTDAGPDEVRAWFDETMADEGWDSNQEWYEMGEQMQRIFFQGEPLENPDFGDRNVIIGVGPSDDGGSFITIAPILNRYQG